MGPAKISQNYIFDIYYYRLCLIRYQNWIVLPYVSDQEYFKLIWLLCVNSIRDKLVSLKQNFFDCFPVICLSQVKTLSLAGGDTKSCLLVYFKILLYQSGTIICPFTVMLKHKCPICNALKIVGKLQLDGVAPLITNAPKCKVS